MLRGNHNPYARTGSSDPMKRRQALVSLIDILSELSGTTAVGSDFAPLPALDEDLPTSLDEEESKTGAEIFFRFEKQIETFDKELRRLRDAACQLGGSVGILSSTFKLRERMTKILFLFRENAANLYPRKIARQPREVLPNQNRRRRGPWRSKRAPVMKLILEDNLEPDTLPAQFESFAKDVSTFLDRLNDFPDFTDEAVNNSMQTFAADLQYWASCLAEYKNQFRSPAVQRYVHDLTTEVGDHIENITRTLSLFVEIGIPTIMSHQQQAASRILNVSTIAAFFSLVTATMLQYSYNSTGHVLAVCVNAFWFSSLVFSFGAAVNGLLELTWKQATFHSPGHKVPRWVLVWIKRSPLVLLVMSIVCFSAGLVLFTYSSGQGLITSTITTALTAVTFFGLAAVSGWFALERWIFIRHSGQKWLEESISEAINYLANTRIARAIRVSLRWCSMRIAAVRGYLKRLVGWFIKPKQPRELLPIVEPPQPHTRTRLPPGPLVYHQEPSTSVKSEAGPSVWSTPTENVASTPVVGGLSDETPETRHSDARERFVNAIRSVIMLQSTARPMLPHRNSSFDTSAST